MAGKYTPPALRSPPTPPHALAEIAREAGLELQAVVPAARLSPQTCARLDAWLAEGRAGDMAYLAAARPVLPSFDAWKPWARSAALFKLPYYRRPGSFRGGGRVARYALGRDYHHVFGRRLRRLGKRLQAAGVVSRFRAVADAAPLLEREWALRGQLGFRGKNTLVLHPQEGPWILLGELLVDAAWEAWSGNLAGGGCGSCTRCLDACPTRAFSSAWSLDPRRCLSYLTIEHRGFLPRPLRAGLGDWVFGCDVCLEVCPFGSHQPDRDVEWGRHPALDRFQLEDLLGLGRQAFRDAFAGSPLRRAGWAGLLRNACVVLGNLGRGGPALTGALEHPEPLVRGHAAWALGRLGEKRRLQVAVDRETDPRVRQELAEALEEA